MIREDRRVKVGYAGWRKAIIVENVENKREKSSATGQSCSQEFYPARKIRLYRLIPQNSG